MKIFRQVSTTERLPEKEGQYLTNLGFRVFKNGYFWGVNTFREKLAIWWMEKLPELPTEEEIKEAIENLPYNDDMSPNDVGLQGANYIINLIKNK